MVVVVFWNIILFFPSFICFYADFDIFFDVLIRELCGLLVNFHFNQVFILYHAELYRT